MAWWRLLRVQPWRVGGACERVEIALLFPRSFLFFLSKKREFVAFPPSRHHGGGASVLHAHKDDADAGAGG